VLFAGVNYLFVLGLLLLSFQHVFYHWLGVILNYVLVLVKLEDYLALLNVLNDSGQYFPIILGQLQELDVLLWIDTVKHVYKDLCVIDRQVHLHLALFA